MTIQWSDLVAIGVIAVAQASFAMDVSRMKVFRTFRQRLLQRATRAEDERRAAIAREAAQEAPQGSSPLPRYALEYRYHGMSRARWLYELVSCPYCFGHYVALAAVLIYRPRPLVTTWWFFDYAISCFLVVTVATLFAGLIHRALDPMPAYADLDDSRLYERVGAS